jgi:S-adenosylmethionine hydrolase
MANDKSNFWCEKSPGKNAIGGNFIRWKSARWISAIVTAPRNSAHWSSTPGSSTPWNSAHWSSSPGSSTPRNSAHWSSTPGNSSPRNSARWISTLLISLLVFLLTSCGNSKRGIVVFQSDFGVKDGAVSAMKGVAASVDPDLKLYDLTHEIPAYNIWEAAYRLEQTAAYWPAGTVFVSVVDPGVGTERKSVVMRSKTGHYFVTPDNGTLTLVAESLGIDEIREINESLNRRQQTERSYTFHGRDVYAFTGARLAARIISFEEVGDRLPDSVMKIPYQKPRSEGDSIVGSISILDIQYGNVWTNINDSIFKLLQVTPSKKVEVEIRCNDSLVFKQIIPFVNTFGDVPEGKPLAYMNSLMNFSLAVNMGNFSETFKVQSGPGWTVIVRRAD